MPIKINGATSGSTTITAPATGGDESIELSTALASKLPYSYGTATPSTTDSGFLWYDSNSTPAAPKFWDGAAFQDLAPGQGLVHIHTETFSAVSSVSVNNKFSATYDAYRIVMKTQRNTSESSPTIRLRASGADETGSFYFYHGVSNGANNTGYNQAGNGIGYFVLGRAGANGIGITSLDIMNPFLTTGTSVVGQNVAVGTTTVFIEHFGGFQDRSTSYDGFTLADGGTLTGTIRIYGYVNS